MLGYAAEVTHEERGARPTLGPHATAPEGRRGSTRPETAAVPCVPEWAAQGQEVSSSAPEDLSGLAGPSIAVWLESA